LKIIAMKKIAALLICLVACGARADFHELADKLKEGLYETTVSMSIFGLEQVPQGVQMAPHTSTRCFTREDIANGSRIVNPLNPRGQANSDCRIENFTLRGDSATYTIDCPTQRIRMDGNIAFTGNGYRGVNSGVMDQGGRPLKTTINFESKYVGACTR
jgi:hypothetical protein